MRFKWLQGLAIIALITVSINVYSSNIEELTYLEDLLLENQILKTTTYIGVKDHKIENDSDNTTLLDIKFGIYPPKALELFLDEVNNNWSEKRMKNFFANLESIRFIRCGKTAVVFQLLDKRQFIIIFEKEILTQQFYEGETL